MADTAERPAGAESGGFLSATGVGANGQAALAAALAKLGTPPRETNLGFVFVSDAGAGEIYSLLARLRETTRISHWIGTVGTGVAGSGVEHHDRPAVSLLVGAFPEDSFRIFQSIAEDVESFERANGAWMVARQPRFAVVHGDPRNRKLVELTQGLASSASLYLVGGLTASRGAYAQIAERVEEGGLSGALFAPDVEVVTGLSQGCSPIGPVRRITEAEANVIATIDERPALEVLKEDMGDLLARNLERAAAYIHVGFPVPGSDTGDYLVRNLVGFDVERGLVAVGDLVLPGQPIMFCRRDADAARQDLRRMLEDVKKRLGGRKAKGGLYYSCVARGPHLFGAEGDELSLLAEVLGDLPLAGVYVNGEVCNDRLYGYTGVLTLFV